MIMKKNYLSNSEKVILTNLLTGHVNMLNQVDARTDDIDYYKAKIKDINLYIKLEREN